MAVDLSSYDSAKYVNIDESIAHAKTNKLVVSNASFKMIMDGVKVQQPETIFVDFMELLKENTIEVELPNSYQYRPEDLSKLVYGTNDLWYIIMYLNECTTFRDFTGSKVKILNPARISLINDVIETRFKKLTDNHNNPPVIDDLTIHDVII